MSKAESIRNSVQYNLQGQWIDGSRPRLEYLINNYERKSELFTSQSADVKPEAVVPPLVRLTYDEVYNESYRGFDIPSFDLTFAVQYHSDDSARAIKEFRALGMGERELLRELEAHDRRVFCEYSSRHGLLFGPASGEFQYNVSPLGVDNIPDSSEQIDNYFGYSLLVQPDGEMLLFEFSSPIIQHPNLPSLSLAFVGGIMIDTGKYPRLKAHTYDQINSMHWNDSFAQEVIYPYTSLRVEPTSS